MMAILFYKKKDNDGDNEKNNFEDQLLGMPKRFTFEDLKAMAHA